MTNAHYSDAAVAKLRTIIDAIEEEIARTPPTAALAASWAELVEVLAIGPEPATRVCPTCQGVGMRAASRCGNCWASLEPLPELPDEPPARGHA